jgi:mRNA interferase HigB
MQVLSLSALRAFWKRHPQAEGPLRAWAASVRSANWATPQDVKMQYGSTVDFIHDNRVVFDVAGNKFRVVAHVAYGFGRVMIKFVGTHAEYDRIDAGRVGR